MFNVQSRKKLQDNFQQQHIHQYWHTNSVQLWHETKYIYKVLYIDISRILDCIIKLRTQLPELHCFLYLPMFW